jgi:hypothetical protein
LAVSRASVPVFLFYAPRLIFGGFVGVGSSFALMNSFSAVPWASGPVFIFCVPTLIFYGTEGVVSRFQFLRSRTCFRRNSGRRVPFSCFALPDSISVVQRASGLVFILRAPGLIFDDRGGVGSNFHVLLSRTHFSVVPMASGLVFMFGAPGLIFDDRGGVGSNFHVLLSRTHFSVVPMASGLVFMFGAPGLIFGGSEGVRCSFLVLRSRTRFRRYRGRRVQFSSFVLPNSFSIEPWASGPVFMFCAPELVFGDDVGSSFHVLRS